MRSIVLAAAAAACLVSFASASPSPPDDAAAAKDVTESRKAFDSLKAEYDKAVKEFNDLYRAAKDDAGRQEALAKRPKPEEWSPRFAAIAKEHAKDAAAANCLAWIVQNDRTPRTQATALEALLAGHLASPLIGNVCSSLQYSQAANADAFLRAVLEKSADRETQARACYTLAKVVSGRADLASRMRSDPSLRGNVEQWYGKDYADTLAKVDVPALGKESEDLLERVVAKFGDVKWGRRTMAEQAKGDLNEIRNLTAGKVAPEVEGTDGDGKAFKLSDYRGKVVLLDFWGEW